MDCLKVSSSAFVVVVLVVALVGLRPRWWLIRLHFAYHCLTNPLPLACPNFILAGGDVSLLLRFGGFVRGPLWAIEFVLESIKTHIMKLMVVVAMVAVVLVVAHSLTLRLPLPYQSLTTRYTKIGNKM